ncbi:aspartate/glutamate racemase family protein [Roseibium sp.]|uniref:aspartate/glutamate racemase family protein n=1 Tax=Roseibium sp. TaxID=1936156 RepID=UPI003B5206DB
MPWQKTSDYIGIIMLDTIFPRIQGDAGNPGSYECPTKIKIVDGAGSPEIVRDGQPPKVLLDRFFAAARQHEEEGAVGLVTTCGFLVNIQRELAQSVQIPVVSSSLVLFPLIAAMTGGRPVGIMTASVPSLGPHGMAAAGFQPDQARVIGFEDVEVFTSAILSDKSVQPDVLDSETIEREAENKARELVSQNPDIGAIILECGNLSPYTDAIRKASGRPVYSILDAARFLWQDRRSRNN